MLKDGWYSRPFVVNKYTKINFTLSRYAKVIKLF